MARTGKIARLPRDIRHELNLRLANGEPGRHLVAWLNTLPEVEDVMDEHFGGRPISEQNLTEWKQGGYEDWLRLQESLQWVQALVEEGAEYLDESDPVPLSDRLAPLAAVALARKLKALLPSAPEQGETKTDRRELIETVRALNELRARDHEAARLKMDCRRWEEERAELDLQAHRRSWKAPLSVMYDAMAREEMISLLVKDLPPEKQESLRALVKPRPPLP